MNYLIITVLLLVLIISLIFVIRTKIIGLMSLALKASYILCIVLILMGLFFNKPFEIAADFTLDQVGVKDQIINLDETLDINSFMNLQDNVFDSFFSLIGNDDTAETDSNEEASTIEPGYFEENLYPSFVSVFAFNYRIISVIIALAGLMAIVYFSYVTSGATDTENLKTKVKTLESRLKLLEAKIGNTTI